ncbi:alpha-L-arabinofuranosidase C-terminal domain-containing protein [Desulfobacca acetoxidans]|uniref:non-reducing end alpha-L-arabinofuranosidase n=1 Tax=Desulfobacca acetoxidans (strain ATCC 700848 / DSM 11109 / ASRB2) TaxID=880072 RepID=F2NHL0_DESAR|nr:alpha-L-arabinofuranosidase C-terminal domain-containing protein [Desulfobacca acetoxidans]AEB09197.1 alpha-L-arabinofuranosidase domain protein [Desulfobacca acetoxidans DSM 11109]
MKLLRLYRIVCRNLIMLVVVWLTASPVHGGTQAQIIVSAAVDPKKIINQKLFGHNVLFAGNGMWDARRNYLETEAECLIKMLQPSVLRFPGGDISDLYIWEDGLGVSNTSLVTPQDTDIALEAEPDWTGVRNIRILDRHDGKYGDLGCFSFQDGVLLRGVVGLKATHPPGASVRPEKRLGQPEWYSHSYGIMEHLQLCELLGAEPIITVNYGSGLNKDGRVSTYVSLSQKVKRAAAWVALVNGNPEDQRLLGIDEEGRDWRTIGYWAGLRVARGRPAPYGVTYWEIGNEVFNRQAIGFCSAQTYAADYLEFVRAMKTVDPTIKIGAVGLAEPHGRGDADQELPWNETILQGAKNHLDFLSVHLYYPSASACPHSYQSQCWFMAVMGAASQAMADLKEIRRLIDTIYGPSETIPIVVSEYGVWPAESKSGGDYANLARALYDADLLMGLMTEGSDLGVDLAAAWNIHGNNPTAAIRFDFNTESRTLRPHFWAQQLLRNSLGNWILPVQVTCPTLAIGRLGNVGPLLAVPELQAMATLDLQGHLALAVLNRSLVSGLEADITIREYQPLPLATVQSCHGDSPAAHNEREPCRVRVQTRDYSHVAENFQYHFPPHSLTIIHLQRQSAQK